MIGLKTNLLITNPCVFYIKVTESINLANNDCTTCNYSSSAYLYQPLGHVVTGDLSIITNKKLRHLIKKALILENKIISTGICV